MDYDSLIHRYQESYYKLPDSIKGVIGSLYGAIPLRLRFGKQYAVQKKILEDFKAMTPQQQLDFQYAKTLETLQFAQDHIPYYQNLFREYGFSVDDFRDFADIAKLPLLTKEIIQKEIDNLYTDIADKPVAYYTGGSSAHPMKMYAPLSVSRAKEKVYFSETYQMVGHRYRERAVSLSARGNFDDKREKYWEYQRVDNYLLVSVNHLKAAYIGGIVEEVLRWKPKTFYGYPSALSLFVSACRDIGIDHFEGVSGVVLTSESVSWEDVDNFRSFFNAPIVSHYGHTERIISAYRINKENYRFFNSYGLVQSGEDHEMIGTSFDNFVMPYIRYATKDYMGKKICYEGTDIIRETSSILGRVQESIITKEHTVIPILSIGAGHFSGYEGVEKAQFYQDTPGKVTLRIQKKPNSTIDTVSMIHQMEKRVDHNIDFDIEFVDHIENTSRGKQRLCIQKLNITDYLHGNGKRRD